MHASLITDTALWGVTYIFLPKIRHLALSITKAHSKHFLAADKYFLKCSFTGLRFLLGNGVIKSVLTGTLRRLSVHAIM
jgi:hypothetical protein